MQNDDCEPSPMDGLPVYVNDIHNVWPTLRVAKSVPLGRLEWLWSSRGTSIRDSSTSARAIFEVSTVKTPTIQAPSRFPHDWYRNPYVFALVTTLKELDLTQEVGWSRIRAFVEECREKLYEYLIILAAPEGDMEKNRRVVERLRGEVNIASRGRERMVIVPPAAIHEEQRPITHLHHSRTHQDLLVRLRECVREGVESRVQNYEQEVSKSYLNRTLKDWSFGEFFVLKEGMAFIFVQLGRRDLAVRFYDELHALMAERDDHEQLIFCDEPGSDAAMGVSNPCLKDYRSMLITMKITELDMRTYVFARQLSLLLRDRKFPDIAERGLKFITALARRCADEAASEDGCVSDIFRDLWVFSTARALASALTPAIPSPAEAWNEMTSQLSAPRERHTARLMAGFQVHAMKAFMGLANIVMPGILTITDPEDTLDKAAMIEEAMETSDMKLKDALSDPKKGEALHAEISNSAASLYEMGGRPRGAAALDGDAGIMRLRNKSYSDAEKLLSAQCSRFINDNGWDDLHKPERLELARAEKALDHVQEYLVSCLTMLYMSRSSRRRWRTLELFEPEEMTIAEEAQFWVAETATVAKRLPRVMKYKAERLFEVLVMPNNSVWVEGDPAEAAVRIKSDIPATIEVDSIVLQCRSTSSTAAQNRKPSLHHRLGADAILNLMDESASAGNGDSPGDQGIGSLTSNETTGSTDIVVLCSRTTAELKTGVNIINVHADEVPHYGRYKVTLVALFIGNLKLVQVASRAAPMPIVTIKGRKNAPLSASVSTLADFANGEVKFPMFFAAQRSPSASLKIDEAAVLYLVPETSQFVHVRIAAGQHGVKKGSKLSLLLLDSGQSRSVLSSRFVVFSEVSQKSDEENQESIPIISVFRLAGEPRKYFDRGEAVIDKELKANEVFECRVAVQALADCGQYRDQSVDDESVCRRCLLQMQLSCIEKDGPPNRWFSCRTEQRLVFSSPVEVSARIELISEWGDEDPSVARAVGLDGTPLGDGGTLICSVRSKALKAQKMTILDAQLELPRWLELRPDEAPAHLDLLPCTLESNSLLTCAFDVLVREEALSPISYAEESSGDKSNVLFNNRSSDRRLSRVIASSADGECEDDISPWAEQRTVFPIGEGSPNLTSDVETYIEESHSNSCSVADEKESGGLGQFTAVPLPDADTRETEDSVAYEASIEEAEMINLREAADVVDLSAPIGQTSNTSAAPSSLIGSESLGTLRLEVKIECMHSVAVFERKINVQALRGVEKRYRIERSVKNGGDNGKLMELEFSVQVVTNGKDVPGTGGEYDELQTEVLHYEVDADPTVWMVIGRRRGKLNMTQGRQRVGSAKLIPVACGRQKVPCVRLFRQDGRGLAFSQYENVNEYMQVAIMPNRNIVSVCSLERMESYEDDDMSGQGTGGKGSMPVVIASDSFFGN